MAVGVRPPGGPWRVVFDGQSRNNYPLSLGPNRTYPWKVMSGRGIPWWTVALDSTPWAILITDVATRLVEQANHADQTVLVMCGGETDIALGATGQQVYDEEVDYINTANASGTNFDYIIGLTMCPATAFTGPQDTARQNHNTLMLADASNRFDAVVDVAADPSLDDATDTTYFAAEDGIHWTDAATTIVADLLDPVLDGVLV